MAFYQPIEFNEFKDFSLAKFTIPPDGHCLFHSLLFSFYTPYKDEILNNKPISKIQIVVNLRYELSEKIDAVYDKLSGGNLCKFAEAVDEFKLPVMKSELNSDHCIGYGYIEYISNLLNKDIYIIDGTTNNIYISDELPYLIKGRNAVVLYYKDHHYEPIGLKHEDNNIYCHFKPCHPFIQFLRDKINKHLMSIN